MQNSKLKIQPNQTQIIFDDGKKVSLVDWQSKVRKRPNTTSGESKPNPEVKVVESNSDLEIQVSRDASLEYYFIWNNTSINRSIIIHLNEEGANAKLTGVFTGDTDNAINLNSTMIHHAPHTTGNTLVKGALNGSAKSDLKGMIKIDKHGQGAEDLLTERIILLSSKARAQAEPTLEIDNNEVKATHAASVSKVNEEQLFYLRSRGLSEEQGKNFIVQGFLQEVIDMFPREVLPLSRNENLLPFNPS